MVALVSMGELLDTSFLLSWAKTDAVIIINRYISNGVNLRQDIFICCFMMSSYLGKEVDESDPPSSYDVYQHHNNGNYEQNMDQSAHGI